MAFSTNLRSWRTVAMATLTHENMVENHELNEANPAVKNLERKGKTISHQIKNFRHAD